MLLFVTRLRQAELDETRLCETRGRDSYGKTDQKCTKTRTFILVRSVQYSGSGHDSH
jgi:hypothetical protein